MKYREHLYPRHFITPSCSRRTALERAFVRTNNKTRLQGFAENIEKLRTCGISERGRSDRTDHETQTVRVRGDLTTKDRIVWCERVEFGAQIAGVDEKKRHARPSATQKRASDLHL